MAMAARLGLSQIRLLVSAISFCVEEVQVRLKPITIDWLPGRSEDERCRVAQRMLEFQTKYLECEDDMPEILVVKVKDDLPDTWHAENAAEDDTFKVPRWLPAIVLKMQRMNWWETVRLFAPLEPPPALLQPPPSWFQYPPNLWTCRK